ncbi:MAG: SIR2 family protein, partial [Paludibacteraceae bacterium]|nr:SIR2 family protein [Paludibacteraceae bacterium]
MDIKEAIEGIFNGESILFVGSGFSFGATNSNPVDDKMKSSTSLSDLLLGECGVNQKGVDLTKASQIYIARHSADELVNFLKKEFVVSSISDDQKFITSMNWLRVYTTNYDDILEKGYALNKKICTPVTLSDKYQNINAKDKQNLIIHLNGFIRTLTAEKLNNEFKL